MSVKERGLENVKDFGPKRKVVNVPSSVGKFDFSNKISLKSSHGKYLSAQLNGCAEWDRNEVGEWEQFSLEDAGSGKFGLKSVHGLFLSAQPDGSVEWDRYDLDVWETWTIEQHGSKVALKSFHGKYLSAQPDGSVTADRDAAKEWETFEAGN